ncbi:low molecular weight protein-tyrosine-phosphatase [Beijerinckia indica]|uniref:protein-tyrosine-phosphatase n=1 Tax=Beijerinckia indica subsp. indica (strain ATCC 9039 / DSM 1715 / NCIMB 8712) TaxID=395963 RepID=B2IBV1_BEII9|nr:low molecular weight protein-tyrosine-phosphatase [Beijerinckia indica]ACB93823.1 protein tyrosine phosphatase [Beijerinckia indica subsp. indica ATCC 9039]
MSSQIAVLFVCTGNICRSPLAEAAFREEIMRLGVLAQVDSAGIGAWHIGDPPDRRAQAVARRHGIEIGDYRARQVEKTDFEHFTHVIALDNSHLRALRRLSPEGSRAQTSLLLDHVPGRAGQDVEDPYYGSDAGFDQTWRDVVEGAAGLARGLWRR